MPRTVAIIILLVGVGCLLLSRKTPAVQPAAEPAGGEAAASQSNGPAVLPSLSFIVSAKAIRLKQNTRARTEMMRKNLDFIGFSSGRKLNNRSLKLVFS